MSHMMRLIDSAQRKVVIHQPEGLPAGQAGPIVFEIQGIWVEKQGQPQLHTYETMGDFGVRYKGIPALRVWDRLWRRPALCGTADLQNDTQLSLEFWSDPHLTLRFDLADPEQLMLWREAHILMRSAGYDFRHIGQPREQPRWFGIFGRY